MSILIRWTTSILTRNKINQRLFFSLLSMLKPLPSVTSRFNHLCPHPFFGLQLLYTASTDVLIKHLNKIRVDNMVYGVRNCIFTRYESCTNKALKTKYTTLKHSAQRSYRSYLITTCLVLYKKIFLRPYCNKIFQTKNKNIK